MNWLIGFGLGGLAVLAVMLAAAALTSRTQTPPARTANRIPMPGGGSLCECGHSLRRHWDAGCDRCNCKRPETQLAYELDGRLPAAGYLDTGPRPRTPTLDDTGPMHQLTFSEIWAQFDRLEREIGWLQRAGDRTIGPTP